MKTVSAKLQHQLIITLCALGSIGLAIGVSMANMGDFEKKDLPIKEVKYPKVSIENINIGTYQSSITAYGLASPRFSLNLTSEVNGRVVKLSKQLESGSLLQKNDLLVTIDDRLYQQAVANAQTQLNDAHVALLQEELNVAQAQQEWQRSGLKGQPDSELVLRQPQLLAAKSKLEYAEKSLQQAKADLEKTQIKTPFSALVISRQVQPAGYLQTGGEIAQLYNTEVIDISLSLSESQWQKLPDLKTMIETHWPVELIHSIEGQNTSSTVSWVGTVTRGEQHINDNSRQRSLIVSVQKPLEQNPPLYPGTFLQANISGRTVENLWQLPASSITQNNQVWYLSPENTLKKIPADIQFSQDDKVYLMPPEGFTRTRILTHPLSSYLLDMKVIPNIAQKLSQPIAPAKNSPSISGVE